MTLHEKQLRWFALTPTFLVVLVAGAGPSDFEITRSTIDGGGEMHSTGNDFERSGTIGQPDAGVMVGDDFELTGGFWFGLPPTDCNEDGLVSMFDHENFTSCLLGPSGGIGAGPCPCFDVDRDGRHWQL